MHTIRIVLGDWSDDGHGKSDTKVIHSSLTRKELERAFKAGVKILDVNITKLCDDYEDNQIPSAVAQKFMDLGVSFDDEPDAFGVNHIWIDEFFAIYMKTCEVGNPDLKWTLVAADDEIQIGGYGLFGS